MNLGQLREGFQAATEGAVDWWGIPGEVIPHLSASSLGMFQRCPEQFRQRYLLGRKLRPQYTWTLGTANHLTYVYGYAEKLQGRLVQPEEAVQYFQDLAWPRALERDGGPDELDWKRVKPDTDMVIGKGSKMVFGYTGQVLPRVEPEDVGERPFTLRLHGLPVPVIGYTDLLLRDGPVLDIKTTDSKTSTISLRWQLQARLYAWALERGVEFHTISRTQTPTVMTALESEALLLPHSPKRNELTAAHLLQLAVGLAVTYREYGPDQVWPANFMSDACGWCGYRSLCAYWT